LLSATLTGAVTTGSTISQAITTPSPVLLFDGVNDAVDLGIPAWSYSTQFRSTMTIECWFKTTDTNNQKLGEFVSRWDTGGMFLLGMTSTGEITSWITNASGSFASINTTTTYKDTLWHHVAVTYNSITGVLSMYIDGVFMNNSTNSAYPTTSSYGLLSNNTTTRLIIGSDAAGTSSNWVNDRQFRGSIAEVRVWNVVRTPTEILNNYKIQLNGNEPGLVSYNKLDQGVANGNNSGITTATNNMLSGGNTGTLLNFALSGTTSNWVSGPPLLSNSLFIPTDQTSPVPFNNIVTTLMTDMSLMFQYATTFNYNISSWNTSAVRDMAYMFAGATAFNQPLNSWNTSLVANMSFMFNDSAAFNQNLRGWNVTLTPARPSLIKNNFEDNSPLALSENSNKLPPFE
jgi:surface protein